MKPDPAVVSMHIGFKQVMRALDENRAKKIFLADDCDEKMKATVAAMCKEKEVPVFFVDSMDELGKRCGIDVKASCAVEF